MHKYFLLGIFAFLIVGVKAQEAFNINHYDNEEHKFKPFIYSILQDNKGYLWIGTGDGVSRYNGFSFENFNVSDGLAENLVSCGFTDAEKTLWWGHRNGDLSYYKNGKFKKIILKNSPKSPITSIKQDEDGRIWCIIQNEGVVSLDENFVDHFHKEAFFEMEVFDVAFANNNLMLVAAMDGLHLFQVDKDGNPKKLMHPSKIPFVPIKTITKSKKEDGLFFLGTEGNGLLKIHIDLTASQFITVDEIGVGFEQFSIVHITEDFEGNLWISTLDNGLIKANYSQSINDYIDIIYLNESAKLNDVLPNLSFEDREGNIWLGTAGNSLYKISDNDFLMHKDKSGLISDNVYAIYVDSTHYYFAVDKGVVSENKKNGEIEVWNENNGLPKSPITSIFLDRDNKFWLGSKDSGVYYGPDEQGEFNRFRYSLDNNSNSILAINGSDQYIHIATKNGLYSLNTIDSTVSIKASEQGILHNRVNGFFKDPNNPNIYVASISNYLLRLKGNELDEIEIKNDGSTLTMTSIGGDSLGNIWIATEGDGVFLYDKKKVEHFTVEDGLQSEYCYSLSGDKNGNIWIGHRAGVSKIDIETGDIKRFDKRVGFDGDCLPNAIYVDADNNVWFGTNKGVFKYVSRKNTVNKIPPLTNLVGVNVTGNDIDKLFDNKTIKLPYGSYKVKFNFIGLSFNNNRDISYEYKLKGYDADWIKGGSDGFATYTKLEEGNYTFLVRACNADGYCSDKTASVKLVITTPYWKETWFISLVTIGGIALIVALIYYRERRQKKVREYLETELSKRTKEVIEQKEELEEIHKDVTDSINYAQRIQKAVIPKLSQLQEYFPDSFILFRPRDVVSGDFYWMNTTSDGRVVIACADATGHGVPGAFMSLIGSAILQDLMKRPDIDAPDKMLYSLDKELMEILSTEHGDQPRDGMDISVCEIDLKTNRVRVSSAMRPYYLTNNGEVMAFKGSRFPIGGGYEGYTKEFYLDTHQLNSGDMIYLFSDGLPDQFGGPKGKKYKGRQFLNDLMLVNKKPGTEQLEHLEKKLDDWLVGYSQVDDILIIGIRLP